MKSLLRVFIGVLILFSVNPASASSSQPPESLAASAQAGSAQAQYELGEFYFNQKNRSLDDLKKAEEWFARAAAQNFPAAQAELGKMYVYGVGVEIDGEKGFDLLQKAASHGDHECLRDLADSLWIKRRDKKKAVELYEKLADEGDVRAQSSLGHMYFFGDLGNGDEYEMAKKWLTKAAENGNAEAQASLGQLIMDHDVGESPEAGIKWYEKAAAQGHINAMGHLALIYYYGTKVPKDMKKAREWHEKGAATGDPFNEHQLGMMYLKGEGGEKNAAKAKEWFEKAAARGETAAMYSLGLMRRDGDGVDKNYAAALQWFRKAAARGDGAALLALGNMYYRGQGTDENFSEAAKCYESACRRMNSEACFNMGVLYSLGQGVERNYEKALRFYLNPELRPMPMESDYNAALIYLKGEGVPEDFEKAADLVTVGIREEPAPIHFLAGIMLYNGMGVKRNKEAALRRFKYSCEDGIEYACKLAEEIEAGRQALISREDIDEHLPKPFGILD